MTTSAVDDLLAGLDPDQRVAASADPTPLMIFAGSGSGKTRCLTHRVAYQILTQVMPPSEAFVSAFTRAAANEMRERLVALVGENPDLVVGTFHSLMFRFLNENREMSGLRRYDICKDSERKRLIKDFCGPVSREQPRALNANVDIGIVSSRIGAWKNTLLHADDEEVLQTAEEAPYMSEMWAAAKVYPMYEAYLAAANKIDFDDMLLKAYDLLMVNDAALAQARARWTAFFTDEYQDTNVAQVEILKLLAPPSSTPNITIVGDVRQALYRFRGAVPEHMDEFVETWKARRIDLNTNYRSTPQIVAQANQLVKSFSLPDQVHVRASGPEVVVAPFSDQLDQAVEVARLVTDARELGFRGGDVAVLIRTNAQSAQFEKAFVAAKLPYWVAGGGFFDRSEVGDLVAYTRLASTRRDEDALRRLINRPTRYLGGAFVDAVASTAQRLEGDDQGDLVMALTRVTQTRGKALSARQRDAAKDLKSLLEHIAGLPPAAAIRRVVEWTEYEDWLKKNSGSEGEADDSRKENIDSLCAVAQQFASIASFLMFIEMSKELQRETKDATEICTVHRFKGREAPIVVVSNFYDDSFPHKRSVAEGLVPDERRVAYVAVTRARDLLVVAVPGENDKGEGVLPSRFLADMGLGQEDDPTDEQLADAWWGTALKAIAR